MINAVYAHAHIACWFFFIIVYSYIGEQVSEGGRRLKDERPKYGCQLLFWLSKNMSSRYRSEWTKRDWQGSKEKDLLSM